MLPNCLIDALGSEPEQTCWTEQGQKAVESSGSGGITSVVDCVIYCAGEITQQRLLRHVVGHLLNDQLIFTGVVADGVSVIRNVYVSDVDLCQTAR